MRGASTRQEVVTSRPAASDASDADGFWSLAGLNRRISTGLELSVATAEKQTRRGLDALARLARGRYGPLCAVEDTLDAGRDAMALAQDLAALWCPWLEPATSDTQRAVDVAITELDYRKGEPMSDKRTQVTATATVTIDVKDALVSGEFVPDGRTDGMKVQKNVPVKNGKASFSVDGLEVSEYFEFTVTEVKHKSKDLVLRFTAPAGQTVRRDLDFATVSKIELGYKRG